MTPDTHSQCTEMNKTLNKMYTMLSFAGDKNANLFEH